MGLRSWMITQEDFTKEDSFSCRMRRRRMRVFETFYKNAVLKEKDEVSILDGGGTINYWKSLRFRYMDTANITLLNLEKVEMPEITSNMVCVTGDVTDLRNYADNQFDLCYSNSVIEHVGDFNAQKRMVEEMMRVGKHCYLQTPNKYFFMEPHFLVPFFQFFPVRLRSFLVERFDLGHMGKAKDKNEAVKIATSVRLLTKKELQDLFPNVKIQKEKLWIFTKSFYLYF